MVAYCQPEMDTPKLSDKQSVGKVCREKWNITIENWYTGSQYVTNSISKNMYTELLEFDFLECAIQCFDDKEAQLSFDLVG